MAVNELKADFCSMTGPLLMSRAAICRGRGCNLSHARSFTCHHQRLVSSPERAVSAWQLTSMCHPSRGRERKAETGSSQTARVLRTRRQRRKERSRRARGGDRTGAETGPKKNTLMNIHHAWAPSCAAYQLIKGLI